MGKVQSCDRSGASDPLLCSHPCPAPRARSAGLPGTEEGAACLDDRYLRARGDGRAHTNTHTLTTRPLPQTQSVAGGRRGSVKTPQGPLREPRARQPPCP